MENVLVVIVTYNAVNWADKCFRSLRESSVPVSVIVIDNGSSDGTQDFIKKSYPEIELYQNSENQGFGKANNIGLQKALNEGYDFVYLLNQDAWIYPDTIEKLISVYKSNSEYGVLSPMQMEANMHYLDNNFAFNVLGNSNNISSSLISDMFTKNLKDVYSVNFVMAAHWLITRECLLKVGGFSPTFYHYGEDDNFLNRVRYWNLKVGIVPSAVAVHDREKRKESIEKKIYITKFVHVLIDVSNPLNKIDLGKYIKAYVLGALRYRQKWLLSYALKLFKQRKKIRLNYEASLKPCAFLCKK